MKFIRNALIALLLTPPVAMAQSLPSPSYKNITLTGPAVVGGLAIQPNGLVVASPKYDVASYGMVGNGTTDNATALTALISSVASSAQGGHIDFPCGRFKFSTALAFSIPNGKHVSITGQGCTELYFPNSNGLVLTYGNNSSYASVSGLKLTTDDTTGAYTALWLKSSVVNTPQNASPSYVDHLEVNGADGLGLTKYWGKGIFQDKVSFLNVDDYNFNGSNSLQGNGFVAQGDATNSQFNVVTNITHSNFAYCDTGFLYGTYYQGLTFAGNNITGCNRGIYSPSGNTLNLQATIIGNQFNTGVSEIEFASEMPGAQIVGNTFLLHGYGIKTAGLINSTISGNSFSAAVTPLQGNAIAVGTSSNTAESVAITGNTCLSIASCINIASGAKGAARDNVTWNVTAPYFNASSTFFQSGNIVNGAQLVSQAGALSGVSYADSVTVNNLLGSKTAPTIASGFCTSPSVIVPNGTWSFRVSVGTACATNVGVVTMPASANGWSCSAASGLNVGTTTVGVDLSASTSTTISIKSYSRTTGLLTNFVSSDVLTVNCQGQ